MSDVFKDLGYERPEPGTIPVWSSKGTVKYVKDHRISIVDRFKKSIENPDTAKYEDAKFLYDLGRKRFDNCSRISMINALKNFLRCIESE